MIEPLPDLGASTSLAGLSLPPEVRLHRFRTQETGFPQAEAQARLRDGTLHGPALHALATSYADALGRKITQASLPDGESLLASLRLWLEDRRRLPSRGAPDGMVRWAKEALRRDLIGAAELAALTESLPSSPEEIDTQVPVLKEGIASPLYVSRAMLECQELADWIATLGLASALDPSNLHVTVAYSMSPVDPADILPDPDPIRIIVDAARPIMIDNALALPLDVSELHVAHRRYLRAGATYDYVTSPYTPHVSIKYDPETDDLARVLQLPAFNGAISLGPEKATILKRGWRPAPKAAPDLS